MGGSTDSSRARLRVCVRVRVRTRVRACTCWRVRGAHRYSEEVVHADERKGHREEPDEHERAQRRHVVNFVVGEAVEGAVEDVPAVGGVEGGEGGNGQGEEGEEEDVDEEERPDEAVLDLEE